MPVRRAAAGLLALAGETSRDVREAARSLASAPVFVLVSVVSLGVGIGLATTVYSEYRSTIFRAVPGVRDPSSLVTILQPVSHASLEAFAANGQFDSLAAYEGPVAIVWRTPSGPERVWGQIVTPNYFDVLGVPGLAGLKPRPTSSPLERLAGRGFGPGDSRADVGGIVISDRFWREHLGADRAIVGKPLQLGNRLVDVAGVAPPGFLGASPMMAAVDLFVPTTADERLVPELNRERLNDRGLHTFTAIGRLRSGLAMEQAEVALDAVAERLQRELRGQQPKRERLVSLAAGGSLFPIRKQDMPMILSFPVVLVGLALWMGCTNVATMALARAMARRRETAIRLALGAGRARIIRRTLIEAVMLSLGAAAFGCLMASFALRSYDRLKPMMPGFIDVHLTMDWTSFAVATAAAIAAGILFGLVPAFRSARADIASGLTYARQHRVAGYRRLSVRNILVLQQVCGSLTMLLLTGFIILGFQRSTSPDPGFDARGLFTASFDPGRDGYTAAQADDLVERLEVNIGRAAGVRSAARSQGAALGAFVDVAQAKTRMVRDPQVLRAIKVERVGPGYFDVMGIPLLVGRGFTAFESRHPSRITIVNETLAREFGGGAAALGRTVEIEGQRHSVVGVVKDVRSTALLRTDRGTAYVPLDVAGQRAAPAITLTVRVEPGVDAPALVRDRARALAADLTVFDVRAVADDMRQIFSMVRIVTFVYGGIGLFGLVLAGVGLGGVTAYAVAQRRKEIGIRMALGARAAAVLKLVLREGAGLVAAGTVLGLFAAMAVGRALAAYVELVSEALKTSLSDPLLLVGAPVLLAVCTMLACYLPARRAIHIDPATTLREE
ncbi:MAG: ABC transporter permease [Bacteroidales bacterium]